MAKKKTKLDKMSKKEKTSLAYALATNLAKHGKPQSPKNERKLTKGEMKKKEKNVMKFKKAFDLEEIRDIMAAISLMRPKDKVKPRVSDDDKLPTNYNPRTGMFAEANCGCGKNPCETYGKINEKELKNPKKADLNKDGKLSSYEKTRGAAIEKAMQKEGELEEGFLSKVAGGLAVIAGLVAMGQINMNDPIIKDLKAKYEQADTQAEKDSIQDEITARLIFLDTGKEQVNEKDKEHKVLSPSELDRLAALPPTDPSFKKDRRYRGKVEIGDELIMVDRNSPAYGRVGKVVRFTQDGVEVDFGRGDKYGIISRRIKGNKITS